MMDVAPREKTVQLPRVVPLPEESPADEATALKLEVRRLQAALVEKIRGGSGKFVCGSQFRGTEQRERPEASCKRCGQWRRHACEADARLDATRRSCSDAVAAADERASVAEFRETRAVGREQTARQDAESWRAMAARADKSRDDVVRHAMDGFDRMNARAAVLATERDALTVELERRVKEIAQLEAANARVVAAYEQQLEMLQRQHCRDVAKLETAVVGRVREDLRVALASRVAATGIRWGITNKALRSERKRSDRAERECAELRSRLQRERRPPPQVQLRLLLPAVARPELVEPPAVARPELVEPPAVARPELVEPPGVTRPELVEPPVVVRPPELVEPPVVVRPPELVEPPVVRSTDLLPAEVRPPELRLPEIRAVGSICVVAPCVAVHVSAPPATTETKIRPRVPTDRLRHFIETELLPKHTDVLNLFDDDREQIEKLIVNTQARILQELQAHDAFADYALVKGLPV